MRLIGLSLSLVMIPAIASAHPGRTDSRGGHHDRKNGGYHYHNAPSNPPSPMVRTEPRSSYQTTPRTTAKTTVRTEPPRVAAAQIGSLTPSELTENQKAKFEHTLGVASKSGSRSIFKIRLIGETIFFPSDSELKVIAEKFDPGTNYSVLFYLPGMDLEEPYWGYAEKTGKYPLKIKKFDERAPSRFITRPSGV